MAVIYDKSTSALIFDRTDPKERLHALVLLVLFNVDGERTIIKIRERIDRVDALKSTKFTAQEFADAVGTGMNEGFFSVVIPMGSPILAVSMAIGENPTKAALEYPDHIKLKMLLDGYAFLKRCGRE